MTEQVLSQDLEIWKPVLGWEQYETSNLGNVISTHSGRRKRLKKCVCNHGYERVYLYCGSRRKMFLVHRLVATHFIANPLGLAQVNHVDGNKTNNSITNLEWCSCRQNHEHAIKNGLRPLGEANYNSSPKKKIFH